ncbi:hypothetical protein D3C74_298440 [compost metagenome]
MLGLTTSLYVEVASSQYWIFHDPGTRTLSPLAPSPSDQNDRTERSTRTGASHAYSSHCVAGRLPSHVAHALSYEPVCATSPSLTASIACQLAV